MSGFKAFSKKQLAAMSWWCGKQAKRYTAVICDGAVRSGKTVCLSLGFFTWAMAGFHGQAFAICGKTVTSLRRNIVAPLLPVLEELGFSCSYKQTQSLLEIGFMGRTNRFYLFGGKDESSAALIQGVTLAGALFDEAALMPRSFVEQALARCSAADAKFWFSCNPEHPQHWFYTEWILKREEKRALYLHFTMKDNPSLSPKVLERYETLYSGAFYERFVLGRWVAAHGAVYAVFSEQRHVVKEVPQCGKFYISCDYGTLNPASFGLWGEADGVWYRIAEYYHDGRASRVMKTDEEYHDALVALADGRDIEAVIVDPSAASFLECIRRRGVFRAVPAKNDVFAGIQAVSELLRQEKLLFHERCRDSIREFALYRWNERAGQDVPVKQNDHAMDDIRYFVMTVLAAEEAGGGFAAFATSERT